MIRVSSRRGVLALLTLVCALLFAALMPVRTALAQQTAPQVQPATPPAAKQQPAQPQGQPAAQPAQPAPTAPPPQPAEPVLPPGIAAPVTKLTKQIESAEKSLQHLSEYEDELGRLRVDVESILAQSTETAESLRPRLAEVKSQIQKLGAPPAKDAPPEAPAIAAERARLTALAQALDDAIKSTELTWVRARQLIEKITVMRHSLFTRNLLERQPSPMLPGLWRDMLGVAPSVTHRVDYLAHDWWRWADAVVVDLWVLCGGVLLLYLVLRFGLRRLTNRSGTRTEPPYPSFFERAVSVAWVAPLRAAPPIAAGILLYGGLDAMGLLYPPWLQVAAALIKAVVVYAALSALISVVLAPREPQWRLVNLADAPARRLSRLMRGIAVVYVADVLLTEMSRPFFLPLTVSVVQAFAASVAFVALLAGILLTPFQPQAPENDAPPVSPHAPRLLKVPLWLVLVAIIAAALAGYLALARFMAQQIVLTGIVVAVGWLGYLAIRAFTREPLRHAYPVSEILEARFGLDAPRRNQLARLTEIALTFGLVICAIPVLMLQWGFSSADIRDGFRALLFGMEIGQFRISLARILLGIVLFIALLFATRLFQRWLREKALQQTRMDAGIVNSIDTVVGYALIGLSALLAISYAGFDITNLAIVAGALSVGIGFGLQSIVNNFVSGLILLIERPIKVGDRVAVGDQQGFVRRISVRATEIETFDRASLIVPNSELITGRVLNWTHRDALAAVSVKVGVGYNSDPDKVLAILLACAEAHPDVLRTPPPGAALDGFGDSALLCSLRVNLADVGKSGAVSSDLRVAIFKALKDAGVEIPFNQLDVNLRDLEAMKGYVSELLAERPNGVAHGEPRPQGGQEKT